MSESAERRTGAAESQSEPVFERTPDAGHHQEVVWWAGPTLRLLGLMALSAFVCFFGLRGGPPLGDHESINALAARYALESGHWLIPQLGETPRIRKMPLGIWLVAGASRLVGQPEGDRPVTTFSARLPSAVAGFANALAVCWLGSMLYGRRTGLVCGLISAGCAATAFYSHNAQVDMVLTLFTTLAFACFWRGAMHAQPNRWFMAAFYLAFALAMLAKAPLPLATVGLSLAVYWFVTIPVLGAGQREEPRSGSWTGRCLLGCRSQIRQLRGLWLVPGVALFVVVVGAWPVYVFMHVDNAVALWRIEYLARFTGELGGNTHPLWYYIPIVFGLTVPFMASLPEAVASPFLSRYGACRRGLAFAFTWAVVGTCFLSLAAFKRPHYLLSVVAAYCLLLGPVVDRLFFGVVEATRGSVRAFGYGIPLLLALAGAAGVVVLRRDYPALIAPYVVAASGAFLVWTAACLTYAHGKRSVSFLCMNLGVPVLLLAMWPAIGRGINFNAEAMALAAAFRVHGIKPTDEIVWADRRPNASVEFYSGLNINRLIDENEMAGLRQDRRSVGEDVYQEIVRRIREKLDEAPPIYIIVRAKHYRMLSLRDDLSLHMVFHLEGFRNDPNDNLVVFTRASAGGADQRAGDS